MDCYFWFTMFCNSTGYQFWCISWKWLSV